MENNLMTEEEEELFNPDAIGYSATGEALEGTLMYSEGLNLGPRLGMMIVYKQWSQPWSTQLNPPQPYTQPSSALHSALDSALLNPSASQIFSICRKHTFVYAFSGELLVAQSVAFFEARLFLRYFRLGVRD